MDRRMSDEPSLVPEEGDRRRPPLRLPLLERVRRNKRAIKAGVAGLLVALFLGLGLWAATSTAQESKDRLAESDRLTRLVCEESNRLRDAERGLWELIIQLSTQNPDPRVPKATRDRQLAEFRKYINTAFGHIDCDRPQALGGAGSPPALAFPAVTRVEENTVTRTRTVYITVPAATRTRIRIVCRLPNGRRCP